MNLKEYLKKQNKTHLIFDQDYTITKMIIDWEKWEEGIERELKKYDKEILESYRIGKITLSDLWNLYIGKYGEEIKDKIIQHNEWFEGRFVKAFEKNKPLIKQIIKFTNYKKYIWSSNTKGVVLKALSQADILDCFEKIVTRNDLTMVKPDIEGFKLIYDPSVSESKYLFIGDSGSDMKAAKNAGIDFFQITYFGNTIDKY